MKKIIFGIIILVLMFTIVACKNNVSIDNNEELENNVTEESNKYNEKIYIDPVYGTEISFEDKIEFVTKYGNGFYYNGSGKEIDVEIIGFEGNLKSADYITPEETFAEGTLVLLNTDGEIYAASSVSWDHSYTEGITVEKINSKDKIKGISYVQTYTKAGNDGRVFLALTEKEELKYLDNFDLTLKDFSIENEKQYGKIFLDLVGKWKLDETLTSKDFKELYYLGTDLQFGEHGEIFIGTSTGKPADGDGDYEIISEENAIIITYENVSSENCKLIYKKAINGSNSSLILDGNDGIKAVWIKENDFNENI